MQLDSLTNTFIAATKILRHTADQIFLERRVQHWNRHKEEVKNSWKVKGREQTIAPTLSAFPGFEHLRTSYQPYYPIEGSTQPIVSQTLLTSFFPHLPTTSSSHTTNAGTVT